MGKESDRVLEGSVLHENSYLNLKKEVTFNRGFKIDTMDDE